MRNSSRYHVVKWHKIWMLEYQGYAIDVRVTTILTPAQHDVMTNARQ